jgi:hypothetical protein
MLSDIQAASTNLLRESRLYLDLIRNAAPSRPGPGTTAFRAAKGLFFVQLYAAIEYTVVATVERAIQTINGAGPTMEEVHPTVLSLALHPECQAISDVGPTRVWEKRWELFRRSRSASPVVIDENLLPSNGSNIQFEQLQSIWTTFAVRVPVVPRPEIRGRLSEITLNRNAIAHGRNTPVQVGSRYTENDLRTAMRSTDELCTYITQSFDNYLTAQDYLI